MNGTLRISDGDFRPAALVPKRAPMVVPTVGQTAEPRLHVLILSKRELIIGRDNTCDHSLISVEVSRRHARITFEDGLWYIHDLGSTNGLFVQGARLTCGEKVVLEDQFDVYFGPPDKGHFKYTFHADFDPALLSASRLPSPDCVDSSGYESVATQDYNSRSSPPLPNEPWKDEIRRLKVENSQLETQLKQEKDHNRMVYCDLRKVNQTMLDREAKLKKKHSNLDGMIKKYRTLIGQVDQSSQPRSSSEDDEASSPFVDAIMDPILREMTCSICAEYLIAPTSLNCSHVFCAHCIDSWKYEYRSKYNSGSNGICPVCREECIWQTPVLPFENIINLVLEKTLTREKLDERRQLIEERKRKPITAANSAGNGTSESPLSLGSFLQLINGMGRTRRPSIVLSSDDSDESDFDVHDEDDDDDFSDEENGNFVEVDYNQESGQVELSLDLPSDVDEGDVIDLSITVHPSLEAVSSSEDDDDEDDDDEAEVLMIDDDTDSSESNHFEIVISDSEDEPRRPTGGRGPHGGSSRRRRRRSSMIILSDDSQDALQSVIRENLQQSSSSSSNSLGRRQSIELLPSTGVSSSPAGPSSSAPSAAGPSGRRTGGAGHRRPHPYRRAGRSSSTNENSGNNNNSTSSRQHQAVCV